jgi:hypothetical protein
MNKECRSVFGFEGLGWHDPNSRTLSKKFMMK